MKDNDEKLQYRIHVTGYVQGVGFRWRTVREAASRRIKGFVRTCPTGVFISRLREQESS